MASLLRSTRLEPQGVATVDPAVPVAATTGGVRAGKTLLATGDEALDGEALLLFACLERIDAAITAAFAPPEALLEGPAGQLYAAAAAAKSAAKSAAAVASAGAQIAELEASAADVAGRSPAPALGTGRASRPISPAIGGASSRDASTAAAHLPQPQRSAGGLLTRDRQQLPRAPEPVGLGGVADGRPIADGAGRGVMGTRRLDTPDVDPREAELVRSDAGVARAALLRLVGTLRQRFGPPARAASAVPGVTVTATERPAPGSGCPATAPGGRKWTSVAPLSPAGRLGATGGVPGTGVSRIASAAGMRSLSPWSDHSFVDGLASGDRSPAGSPLPPMLQPPGVAGGSRPETTPSPHQRRAVHAVSLGRAEPNGGLGTIPATAVGDAAGGTNRPVTLTTVAGGRRHRDASTAVELQARYAAAWREEAAAGRRKVEAEGASRAELLRSLLDAKRAARRGFAAVNARRDEFERTAAQLGALEQSLAAAGEEPLDAVVELFRPPPVPPGTEVDDGPAGAATSAVAPLDHRPPELGEERPDGPVPATRGRGPDIGDGATFAPGDAVGSDSGGGCVAPPPVAEVLATLDELLDDGAGTRALAPEVRARRVAAAKRRSRAASAVSGAVPPDELVVTRVFGAAAAGQLAASGAAARRASSRRGTGPFGAGSADLTGLPTALAPVLRTVRQLDPAGTFIGMLLSILRFAPARHAEVALQRAGLVDQAAALRRQAAVAGIAAVWDDVADARCPVVHVLQLDPRAAATVAAAAAARPQPILSPLGAAGSTVMAVGHASALSPPRPVTTHEHVQRVAALVGGVGDGTAPLPDPEARDAAVDAFRVADGRVRQPRQDQGAATELVLPNVVPPRGMLAHLAAATRAGQPAATAPVGENLVTKGVVRCYASSSLSSVRTDSIVAPVVDRNAPFFSTDDLPGQHVTVSLRRVAVQPTGYSIACTHPVGAGHYPRSWRLEGSADGQVWHLLQRHRDDTSLSRYTPVGVWPIPPERAGALPFWTDFRITQEGPNALGTRHLSLVGFEIFGRALFIQEAQLVPADRNLPPMPMPRSTPLAPSAMPPAPRPKGSAKKKKK